MTDMINAVFYIIVAIWVIGGYNRGAAKAGCDFTAVGMASYFSVWLLPLSLLVLEYIPEEFAVYSFLGVLVLSAIIIFVLIKSGIDQLTEKYPAFDSDVVLSEMPVINKVFGALFGFFSGCFVTSFFMLLLSFSPVEIPYVTTEEFCNNADSKVLSCSRAVNCLSSSEWNRRQKEYLASVAEKFRTAGKPAKAETPAAEDGKPEASGAQTASGHADEAAAAQKLAAKAVKSIGKKQDEAVQAAQDWQKPSLELTTLPGDKPNNAAVQEGNGKSGSETPGVTFTLLLPKLREDGSNSGDTHPVKVGIRLAKNGKVPRVIDIEAPHPVVNSNRRVYRKVRVDMGEVFYAPVRNLKPELDTKYSVVEIK